MTELSGRDAYVNPRSLDGARAAIGEINAGGGVLGRAVELVVEDSLSTVEGSVAGYDRIRAEIDALGGLEPNGAAALLDAVTEDGMPTMCPLCGTSDLESGGGDFLWGLTVSRATYGVVAAQLARDLGYSRVALLVRQAEPWWGWLDGIADAFRGAWASEVGGEITAAVEFVPGFGSYTAEVQQVIEGDPEALFIIAGYGDGDVVISDVIGSGYEGTILVSPDLAADDIAEIAAELPTGRVLGASVTDDFDSPAYTAFAAAHIEHAGKLPQTGFYEANQYDQYIALALAMTAAGSSDGPAVAAQVPRVLSAPGTKVYTYADGVAALERGEDIDYDGASSSLDMNQRGDLVSPTVRVLHVDEGLWFDRETIELDPNLSLQVPRQPLEESGAEPSESESVEEPVRFGFLSGLSGDYSYFGPASLDGARAAIGEINANGGVLGRPLELVVEDNLSTAEGSVAGYNRIREEIHALGGLESDGAVALLNTVAEDQMPTMCPVCGTTILDTEGGNFVWRLTASDTTFGVMSAQLGGDLGYTRVAMLVQQTEGTESPANVFKDVWENKISGEITADVRFAPGHDSYQAEVEQAFASDPDAVYIGAGPRAGISIIGDYIAQGHTAPILISPDLLVPEFAGVATALPIGRVLGVIMTDDFESPAYDTFVAAHLEYTGKRPPTGFLEANQYDQYIALALAMTAAGSTDGPAVAAQVPRVLNAPGTKVYSYADGVAALERGEDIDYDGASGPLEINRTGNVISLIVSVYHVVNGEFASPEVFELDPDLSR